MDAPQIWTQALDPMRAEVRVRLPWPLELGAEIRGRLMGPRCRFATTVEVAYPFRLVEPGVLAAIIPEPSLWEPACPFLYEGPLELWSSGQLRQHTWLRHCVRTLKQTANGLLLNGQRLELRGVRPAEETEAELLELRQRGFNMLTTAAPSAELRELADRLGFLLASDVN